MHLQNREVCVMSDKPASNIGILRISDKEKYYCSVIASRRRSNPYACRLLRHPVEGGIPRNDNLAEGMKRLEPFELFKLLRRWIVRSSLWLGAPSE
jgi:hypothetical protein